MPKILLIIPPLVLHSDRDVGFKETLPHIGFSYIASYLKSMGLEVRIVDSVALNLNLKNIINIFNEYIPDVVGITASTYQIYEAAKTARAIKDINPEIPVLIGGYHTSAIPGETLREFEEFDFAICGEGEYQTYQLIKSLLNKDNFKDIRGIAYREGREVVITPKQPRITDLNSLPFPAFELLPTDKYRGLYTLFSKRERALPISTIRGCPYNCVFCFKSIGSNVKYRSPANVIEELKRDVRNFGVTQIVFTDEMFSLDRERACLICEEMIRERLNTKIKWVCQNRVDTVDPELLTLMKRAGCGVISYGIESGNQEVLEKIKKNFKLPLARDAIKWTREAGIMADTNFIIGHPYDTISSIKDTINFAVEINPDTTSFAILTPLPGTEVAKMAPKGIGGLSLIIEDDWSKYGKQIGEALELRDIKRHKLERFHRQAYMRFYLRPKKFLNLFKVVNMKAIPIYLYHSLKIGIKYGFKQHIVNTDQ